MWRDTIIEEDNRIVATGDNVRMNTREIADLFNITAASVNRAPIFPELTNGWLIRISLFLFDIQKYGSNNCNSVSVRSSNWLLIKKDSAHNFDCNLIFYQKLVHSKRTVQS